MNPVVSTPRLARRRLYDEGVMTALRDFLAMGGYASFVWPAYAVAAIVLAGLGVHSLAAYRRCQRELARLQQVRSRRGSAA